MLTACVVAASVVAASVVAGAVVAGAVVAASVVDTVLEPTHWTAGSRAADPRPTCHQHPPNPNPPFDRAVMGKVMAGPVTLPVILAK